MISTCVLTTKVYTENALDKTIAAFSQLCATSLQHKDAESIIITLETDRPASRDEFLNYLLVLSAQENLA